MTITETEASLEVTGSPGDAGPSGTALPDGHVLGAHCNNGHFTDPRLLYCSVCGISLSRANRVPTPGRRPQLGVLVLDNGAVLRLDRDHVLGRNPAADPDVEAGSASPVRMPDPSLSGVHAKIVLVDWDVHLVDGGSAAGTYVWGPTDSAWTKLPRGGSVPLRAGTAVAFGGRSFCYHSYRRIEPRQQAA